MCTKNHSLFPFVSDPNLPAINVNVTEGRNNLWSKTKRAFAYMYEHHKDEADWFLKADDDTYTVVENLRYMLQPYDASKPIYFGCKFKPIISPHLPRMIFNTKKGHLQFKRKGNIKVEVTYSQKCFHSRSNLQKKI